ncbi:MAG: diaminopimelate epimerase [Bacteroidota bacterium]
MKIPFHKYQGTGNDFVIIDNRNPQYLSVADTEKIQHICDRRFGIGADGLILLQEKEGYDFEMVYFNADGRTSSMCGNGGRCIVAFAGGLGLIDAATHFWAIDGAHEARLHADGRVELKMNDVATIEHGEDYFILDTGSPHYVIFVEDVDDINVVENGQAIRYSKRFRKEGINVNFVEPTKEALIVATYERGVEDETLSCGTGVTAAGLAYALKQSKALRQVAIKSKGGELEVRFEKDGQGGFRDIWLCGPADLVFSGLYGVG